MGAMHELLFLLLQFVCFKNSFCPCFKIVLFTSRNEHAFLPSPYLRKVQYNTFFVIAVLSKRFRDFGIFIFVLFYYTSIRPCSHYPMQLLITHLPMYKKDSIFFFCKKKYLSKPFWFLKKCTCKSWHYLFSWISSRLNFKIFVVLGMIIIHLSLSNSIHYSAELCLPIFASYV